jgi:hypothetical protein
MVVGSFADIKKINNQSHCELLIDMRPGKNPTGMIKNMLQSLQKLYSYTALQHVFLQVLGDKPKQFNAAYVKL